MPGKEKPTRRPAQTVEGRENQLVTLAIDLAEKQLEDGTASSQVMTHFLKLGTVREQMDRDRMQAELDLMRAKIAAMESQQSMEAKYAEALDAMRVYTGQTSDLPDGED